MQKRKFYLAVILLLVGVMTMQAQVKTGLEKQYSCVC